MPIDARIRDAIRESVHTARQPTVLARRLEAWFDAVSSGNEDINDPEAAERHLEVLFDCTIVEDVDSEVAG